MRYSCIAVLVIGTAFLSSLRAAQAVVVSMDFATGNDQGAAPFPTFPLASTDLAGVVHVANWNNLLTNAGTQTALNDDAGNATSASVTWSGNGTYDTARPTPTSDYVMMHAGIDQRGTPGTLTFTLPASITGSYDVYAYFDAITTNGAVVAGYNIGSQTYWTSDTAAFSGTYAQATGTTLATATAASNYARFTNVSGSTFTLTYTPGPQSGTGANFRAELMGVQVVGVPEPASCALLSMGLFGMIVFARRNRRR